MSAATRKRASLPDPNTGPVTLLVQDVACPVIMNAATAKKPRAQLKKIMQTADKWLGEHSVLPTAKDKSAVFPNERENERIAEFLNDLGLLPAGHATPEQLFEALAVFCGLGEAASRPLEDLLKIQQDIAQKISMVREDVKDLAAAIVGMKHECANEPRLKKAIEAENAGGTDVDRPLLEQQYTLSQQFLLPTQTFTTFRVPKNCTLPGCESSMRTWRTPWLGRKFMVVDHTIRH